MTLLSSLTDILWGSPCSFTPFHWVPLKVSLSSPYLVKVALLRYGGWSLPRDSVVKYQASGEGSKLSSL